MLDDSEVTTAVRERPRWMSPGTARYASLKPRRERVKVLGRDLYGIEFTREIRMEIERLIREQDRRAKPERRLTGRTVIHRVNVDGIGWVRVVYAASTNEITDVLPPASRG